MKTANKIFLIICTLFSSAVLHAQNLADGYEYVDLGLPSGTLWAACNVGADAPEAPGNFFAWGETVPVAQKTGNYFDASYSKYNNSALKELLPEDDAARKTMGKNWRMPTAEQFRELTDNCSWEYIDINGVSCAKASGSNGNTLLLPYPGTYLDPNYEDANPPVAARLVNYWTRTISDDDSKANYVYVGVSSGSDIDGNEYTSAYFSHISDYRENCNAVRAVYEPGGNNENVNCLVLWHKDGSKMELILDEKPNIAYAGDSVAIQTSSSILEYAFASIRKMTYSLPNTDAIKDITIENEKTFSNNGDRLSFYSGDKDLNVKVISMNGVIVKALTIKTGETKEIPFHSLQAGIYIISVNGITYKINIR